MSNSILYPACPVCGSVNIYKALTAKDYTVSGEVFDIWECGDCYLRFTQNVPDAAAILPYYKSDAYVSHTNTKKGIVNRLYHLVRERTLVQKRAIIKKETNIENGRLLDVGAGTGAFVSVMQQAGWSVVGLEPDEGARNHGITDFHVDLQPVDSLFSLVAQSFDAITLWHVLEHVHRLHEYMETFYQLLKISGTLVIAVPNYTSADAVHYEEYWAAYDVPRHLYHFSPQSMDVLAQKHGFEVVHRLPMKYDSFYVSMLSESHRFRKNNLLKAFIAGWHSNREAGTKADKFSSVIYILRKK